MEKNDQSFKEYLRSLLVAQKILIKKLDEKTTQLSELQEKVRQAESNPNIEVAPTIYNRVSLLNQEVDQIKKELSGVNTEIAKAKEEFGQSGFSPSVDVDMLEAEMETLLGEDAERLELEKKLAQEKVESDMESLKKELGIE